MVLKIVAVNTPFQHVVKPRFQDGSLYKSEMVGIHYDTLQAVKEVMHPAGVQNPTLFIYT